MQEDVLSIEEAFGNLCDPRSRTPAHDLTEMRVVALCAVLSGADSWVAIQAWAEAKLDWHVFARPPGTVGARRTDGRHRESALVRGCREPRKRSGSIGAMFAAQATNPYETTPATTCAVAADNVHPKWPCPVL
ncbi:MAG: transposase family protein [Paraburkholderia sp.]|jgi:hypothetical protein|uniref:transposase family protein n=1 Tax=Paraburkholderia sp. TaxID=1926495 RepID=UPI000F178824